MEQDEKNSGGVEFNTSSKDLGVGASFQKSEIGSLDYPKTPKIVQWVIKFSGGIIKNEKQANYVLIMFALVAIMIALFLFFSGGPEGQSSNEQFPVGSSVVK